MYVSNLTMSVVLGAFCGCSVDHAGSISKPTPQERGNTKVHVSPTPTLRSELWRTDHPRFLQQVDCNGLLGDFEECYKSRNEAYNPTCFCYDYETYTEAVCHDAVQRCLEEDSSICARGSAGPQYDDGGNLLGSWTSYESGVTKLSMYSSPNDEEGNQCYLNVNDEACSSCVFKKCVKSSFGSWTITTLGFEADCSNHGYSSSIDSCDEDDTSAGLMRLFFKQSTFHLNCIPDEEANAAAAALADLWVSDAPTVSPTSASQPLDLTSYGYPYTQDAAEWWVNWDPQFDKDISDFESVTTPRECAAKCQELNAPSGAWNSRHQYCMCYFVTDGLCKEPCIQEEGFDFSSVPMSDLAYCNKSFCDEDMFYNEEYCVNDIGFDKDQCDVKIKEIFGEVSVEPTESPSNITSINGDLAMTTGPTTAPTAAPTEPAAETSGDDAPTYSPTKPPVDAPAPADSLVESAGSVKGLQGICISAALMCSLANTWM